MNQLDTLGRIPVARIIERVDAFFDKNNCEEAGRLLTYWRDEAIALRDKNGELAMESELVGYYRKQNNREKGLVSIAHALTLTKELDQSELVSGATILINCATAYKAFGMVQEALPLFMKAEQTYKKLLPAGDTRMGGLYNNMALAFVDLKRFEDAESAYLSALSVMRNVPRGEAEAAITYINMAHMYEDADQNEKISECMKKAYSLLKSKNLPHNGYYAFVLEKCAPSFKYFGDYEIYEELKGKAKEIYART